MTAPMSAEEREQITHKLKCWPEFYDPIALGLKSFEVRKNDRDFRVGDLLAICEWCPRSGQFTGARCVKYVSYLLAGGQFGLEPGYVVMGLLDAGRRSARKQRRRR